MKVGRTKAGGQVGAAVYARRTGAAPAPEAGEYPVESAAVLGIPQAEFTPQVRDAIMALMAEVASLRRELQSTKSRLEEVEKAADQDQLLPLLNRRAFVRELTRSIGLADRYGTPSSLIFFDLDEFKAINDTHGHAAGDAVLLHFAQILQTNVRDSDIVGRLGGDEFGVILSHATRRQAHIKADSLAAKLKATPTVWNGLPIAVTFSYGAFELRPGDNADTAMARADAAMYSHKKDESRKNGG